MARLSIGLDFGSTAFRAVLLEEDRSENGIRLLDYYEFIPPILPPENRPDPTLAYREQVKELLLREMWRPAAIADKVPGDAIVRRVLEFPFQDRSKLEAVVPFELEGLIAEPVEDLVIDFQLTEQSAGKTKMLTVAVGKQHVADRLKSLDSIGVDPSLLDDEVLALSGLLPLLDPVEAEGPGAIVEIGAGRTRMIIFRRSRVRVARSFRLGGDHLTQVIAESRGIPWEEAESLKVRGEGEPTGEVLDRAWSPLLRDIGLTLDACRREEGEPVKMVFLCGRSALIRNLPQYFSSRLAQKCERIGLQGGILLPRAFSSDFDCGAASVLGVAIRKVAPEEQAVPVNFRKGEFAYRSRIEATRGRLLYLGVMLAVLVVLGLTQFFLRYANLRSEDRALTEQIRGLFFTTFPESKQVPLGYELHEMRNRLKSRPGEGDLLSGSLPVVDLLREISQRIPKEISVDVRELIYDPDKVRIRGRTDSFETIDRIKSELAQFPPFSSIEVTDAKVSIDQQGVDFTILIHFPKEG